MDAGKEWVREIENGLLPDAHKLTLGEWIDRWLEDYVKPSTRIKTYERYHNSLAVHIKPAWGKVILTKMKSPDIQRFLNRLQVEGDRQGKGLVTSTVKTIRRNLITCLGRAVKLGLIPKYRTGHRST